DGLRLEYEAARGEYEMALAESTSLPSAAERVSTAADKLNKAVSALDAAQDALSAQFLSNERIDSLDAFVQAVTEAKADGSVPERANKATVAFILLPGLIDDARASLAQARKPLALPLLIRRNHERLKLEAATREIEARRAIVRLSMEIVEADYERAVQLWLASRDLDVPGVKALHGRRCIEAFSTAGPNEKELMYMSAARYLDTLNRLTARRYRLEYLRVAAWHELALAYAEVDMKQWQSLIAATESGFDERVLRLAGKGDALALHASLKGLSDSRLIDEQALQARLAELDESFSKLLAPLPDSTENLAATQQALAALGEELSARERIELTSTFAQTIKKSIDDNKKKMAAAAAATPVAHAQLPASVPADH
ncbi:MAG TPA: hypothetical protein VFP68_19940, partial [Burkholderiaceae bacterium]|nr:hypothetical protein [Burkholderiaceae bacterium]